MLTSLSAFGSSVSKPRVCPRGRPLKESTVNDADLITALMDVSLCCGSIDEVINYILYIFIDRTNAKTNADLLDNSQNLQK